MTGGERLPAVRRDGPALVVGTAPVATVRDRSPLSEVARIDKAMQADLAAERAQAIKTAQAIKDVAALEGLAEMVQDRFTDFALGTRDQHLDEPTYGIPGDDETTVPNRWVCANARATFAVERLHQNIDVLMNEHVEAVAELVRKPVAVPDARHPLLRIIDPNADVFPL